MQEVAIDVASNQWTIAFIPLLGMYEADTTLVIAGGVIVFAACCCLAL